MDFINILISTAIGLLSGIVSAILHLFLNNKYEDYKLLRNFKRTFNKFKEAPFYTSFRLENPKKEQSILHSRYNGEEYKGNFKKIDSILALFIYVDFLTKYKDLVINKFKRNTISIEYLINSLSILNTYVCNGLIEDDMLQFYNPMYNLNVMSGMRNEDEHFSKLNNKEFNFKIQSKLKETNDKILKLLN